MLSDVVPSNIVSRQVRVHPPLRLIASSCITQESEGVESEYAEDQIDELQSEDEAQVRLFVVSTRADISSDPRVATRILFLIQGPSASAPSPSKLAKIQASAHRQVAKEKRKAAEDDLHAKREVMDKAKVSIPIP